MTNLRKDLNVQINQLYEKEQALFPEERPMQ